MCRSIEELDQYAWCGHAGLMGNRKYDFQNTNDVLRRFGEDNNTARAEYRKFIVRGIAADDGREFNNLIRKGTNEKVNLNDHKCWVIGDHEFVKSTLEHDTMRRLRVASFQKEGVTVKSVAEGVAGQMGIETGALLIRGRKNGRSMGRKIVAAIAHRTYGIPLVEIARYFGIGSSSVSRMLEQGEAYAKENTISLKH